jgi:hypothetical protein
VVDVGNNKGLAFAPTPWGSPAMARLPTARDAMQEGNEMEAWILIGVALLYALITLAGYLDRRDDRRAEQQRLRGLGWKPPIGN